MTVKFVKAIFRHQMRQELLKLAELKSLGKNKGHDKRLGKKVISLAWHCGQHSRFHVQVFYY
jgi:hypothetical protein